MKKIANILFLLIAVATILEYLLICGMFTGPLISALVLLVGLFNTGLAVKARTYNVAALYLIATVALCMGYWKLMF